MESCSNHYEIRVQGAIGSDWADWFDGMEIRPVRSDETAISGCVRDQAALHGLLARIADLNLPLISVNRISKEDRV